MTVKCRDCLHMDVPEGQKIYQNKMYQCKAPVPNILHILPYSITSSYWFNEKSLSKAWVESHRAHDCPCFFTKKVKK